MTATPSPAPPAGSGSANQDRRRLRRWLVTAASIALALLIGSAAVYAGVRPAGAPEPDAAQVPPGTIPTGIGLPPDFSLPTDQPGGEFGCLQVLAILNAMIGVDADYVESRRDAADRLRELETASPAQQAALDQLADELDAAAQMVEDDPGAEVEALGRESAASDALVETGVC